MNLIGRLNRFAALRGAALLSVLGAVAASPAFADTTFGPNAQGDIVLPAGAATTRAGSGRSPPIRRPPAAS